MTTTDQRLPAQRVSDIKTISILGSGWLGFPLAERFVARGFRVRTSTTSADRLPALTALPSTAFVVDIGNPMHPVEAFLESDILIVNITSRDIAGFERLVQAIESSAVEKVIFASSTSVYPADSQQVTESDGKESPQHPLVIIENLFAQNPNFQTTILRFAGLIGYNRHPGRFFRGDRQVSNADTNVNLIHRDDCINIIDRIVSNGVWGETLNCCADTHPGKREFYSRAAAQLGLPPPVFLESGAQTFKLVDNRKLKRLLDYEFIYPDLMAIEFGEHS